ncbi:MAG: energy transducer TonB [Desulfuromonadaceae bacterium]|nr:energy transducer TonB [Desulfuromonadaceae bacterium]
MNSRVARIDSGAGVSFIASAVIHLAVFLLLVWWNSLFPQLQTIQETYYVDVVNLPTLTPQSGVPDSKSGAPEELPPPAPIPPLAPPQASALTHKTTMKTAKTTVAKESVETESEFAERMAKLGEKAEARQYEERLKKLSSTHKSVGSSKVGMPGTSGTETGSRYADYIKSRLEDALKITSSYTTKNPEVAVRLTITADGKLSRMKIERSSGDVTFELAVRRAIDLASSNLTAPPGRTLFENGFIFRPKSISSGKSR